MRRPHLPREDAIRRLMTSRGIDLTSRDVRVEEESDVEEDCEGEGAEGEEGEEGEECEEGGEGGEWGESEEEKEEDPCYLTRLFGYIYMHLCFALFHDGKQHINAPTYDLRYGECC